MTQTSSSEELNPFLIAQRQADDAARYLPELQPGLIEFLKQPDKPFRAESWGRWPWRRSCF